MNYEEFKQKYNLNNCILKFNRLISCIKKIVRIETEYKDIYSNIRPRTNLDSPIFQTVDGGVIDIQKAKSRIYSDKLVAKKLNNPQLYGNGLKR